MEISRNRKINFMNIIRYIVALPVGIILFYSVGELLLALANWSYMIELNKFLVLPIILMKNMVFAASLYIIIPNFKKSMVALVGSTMIILSVITTYLYVINGEMSLASIYIIQIIIWIGIFTFIHFKLSHK